MLKCTEQESRAAENAKRVADMIQAQVGSFIMPQLGRYNVIIRTRFNYCAYSVCVKVNGVWYRESAFREVSTNLARKVDPVLNKDIVDTLHYVNHFTKLQEMMTSCN